MALPIVGCNRLGFEAGFLKTLLSVITYNRNIMRKTEFVKRKILMTENEGDKIPFGGRLKQVIFVLRINQKKFSELTKIPQSTLSQIIKGGEPNSETIKKIANIGINTHWLMTGEGEMILTTKTEKVDEAKAISAGQPMSRKDELILKLMERFSKMDLEKLRRWEKVVAAMLNEEVAETPQGPEKQDIDRGTS